MEHSKRQDAESFRRTIMKQEEIFRYQVLELHRLYRVQKSLMTELNQSDQNFNSNYCVQRMEQDKEISRANFRTSASTFCTTGHDQYYDIHSDGESDGIDLSLAIGIGIGSRPKRNRQELNHSKSNSTGVPWLYQALS